MASPSRFFRHATLLFLALRAADLINLAVGFWVVPRFVDRADLGAVLPVVSFATALATPVFAFAFVLMRESNRLAAERAFGRLKALLRGAFTGTALALALAFVLALILLPRLTARLGITSQGACLFALTGAFLGSIAPVYQDVLNGLWRFGDYGIVEIAAATVRAAVLLVTMPFRPLLGFFAGGVAQPLTRILGTCFLLRRELSVRAERLWSRQFAGRLVLTFLGVLAAMLAPFLVNLAEQSLVRTALSTDASADYYLLTRLTDLLGYLTLPIMLVLFPYAAETARKGDSTRPLVLKSSLAALIGALLLGAIYVPWGADLLRLFPNAGTAPQSAHLLVPLLAVNLLGAISVFYTNAEIAAGRFRFLGWFLPLHAVYLAMLASMTIASPAGLKIIPSLFLPFAALRALAALGALGVR